MVILLLWCDFAVSDSFRAGGRLPSGRQPEAVWNLWRCPEQCVCGGEYFAFYSLWGSGSMFLEMPEKSGCVSGHWRCVQRVYWGGATCHAERLFSGGWYCDEQFGKRGRMSVFFVCQMDREKTPMDKGQKGLWSEVIIVEESHLLLIAYPFIIRGGSAQTAI